MVHLERTVIPTRNRWIISEQLVIRETSGEYVQVTKQVSEILFYKEAIIRGPDVTFQEPHPMTANIIGTIQ